MRMAITSAIAGVKAHDGMLNFADFGILRTAFGMMRPTVSTSHFADDDA